MDYIEIMDYCGYDLEKSDEIAKEIIEEILREMGLERSDTDVLYLQSKPSSK